MGLVSTSHLQKVGEGKNLCECKAQWGYQFIWREEIYEYHQDRRCRNEKAEAVDL